MNTKVKVLGLAGLMAVVAVGGTFAYYTAQQTFQNPFDTTNYTTYATEKFNPADGHEWKPGTKVDKEVLATNTGDVWVRVKMNESWTKEGATDAFQTLDSKNDKFNPVTTSPEGTFLADTFQTDAKDGQVPAGDGSVVHKEFKNVVGSPVTGADNWYFCTDDGYFYYTTTLGKGESTQDLLDYVALCADADMGLFHDVEKYCIVDEGATAPVYPAGDWKNGKVTDLAESEYEGKDVYTYKANELDDTNQGYSNAKYELDITVEFIQTTDDGESATASGWAWYPGKA